MLSINCSRTHKIKQKKKKNTLRQLVSHFVPNIICELSNACKKKRRQNYDHSLLRKNLYAQTILCIHTYTVSNAKSVHSVFEKKKKKILNKLFNFKKLSNRIQLILYIYIYVQVNH